MAVIKKLLGKNIKKYRKTQGYSQEYVALEVGLKNRASIGLIERGERNPSVPILTKIAKVLKVSLDELFRK